MSRELQTETILMIVPPEIEGYSEELVREYLDKLPRRKFKREYNRATKHAAKVNKQKGQTP